MLLNKVIRHVNGTLDAIEEAVGQLYRAKSREAREIRAVIGEALDSIGEAVCSEGSDCLDKIAFLRPRLEDTVTSAARGRLENALASLRESVAALPVRYKAVLLPYYDNVWDTLASVYEAFAADEDFLTEVVIIPIQRNTVSGQKFVYEDFLSAKGIPVTPYESYDFAADEPDIVVYCNPYDAVNIEKFQTWNIRPHAQHMVYIPYYMFRHTDTDFSKEPFHRIIERMFLQSGPKNADVFVAQCAQMKALAQQYAPDVAGKIAVLGSPKADYLHAAKESGDWPHYPDWEKAMEGKKVILLNTHYSSFDQGSRETEALRILFARMRGEENAVLLWRPHPQTFIVFDNAENETTRNFYSFVNEAMERDNIILDRTGDALSALMYADAVISSRSSIVGSAIYLDLPTYTLEEDPLEQNADIRAYARPEFAEILEKTHKIDESALTEHQAASRAGLSAPLDISSDAPEEEITVAYIDKAQVTPMRAFLEDVLAGRDEKRALRRAFRAQSFANAEGGAGAAIEEYCRELVKK